MIRKIFLTLLLGFIMQSQVVFSQDVIRFSTMDIPPWGFLDEKGNPSGIFSDIASNIAKEAGLSYENRVVPYRRMMYDLETGNADIIMLYPNKQIEAFAFPIAPLVTVENIVIGLKDTNYQTIDDLHGKTVGYVRGANYDDRLTSDPLINGYETKNYEQNLRMLFFKRLNAVAGPSDSLFFTAKKMGYAREQFGKPLVLNVKEPWAFYARERANERIVFKLKNAIESLKKEKVFDKIVKHYLEE